jgi:hypothetical protein
MPSSRTCLVLSAEIRVPLRLNLFGMAEDPLHSPVFIKTLLYFRMDRLEEELDAAERGTKGWDRTNRF